MVAVTFENRYKAGHSYTETWELTAFYCPKCGCLGVWHDAGSGDIYADEQYICSGCEFSFHMPYQRDCSDDNDRQRLQAIRSVKPELSMGTERPEIASSFVVDFPKFEGDPESLPKADVLSVELCVDGSVIYESNGLTSVELPVNDSPYDRGYQSEQAGIGWYSNPYPENTVEFRRWVDGKVQAIIDTRVQHETERTAK